jgi:thiamine-monophosphate kinase
VCALNGGEDYELLFTIDQSNFEKLKNHEDISFIGYMTDDKEVNLATTGGQKVPIEAQGWNHFNG